MVLELIEPFLWILGVGLCLMALFTFTWPRYQFKFMKIMKLEPSIKSDEKIRKLAVIKLALGLAVLALTAIF